MLILKNIDYTYGLHLENDDKIIRLFKDFMYHIKGQLRDHVALCLTIDQFI